MASNAANQRYRILVVEDDAGVRGALADFLGSAGYQVAAAGTCKAAEQFLGSVRCDLAIIDYALPDGTGLDLLARLQAIDKGIPVILLTGQGSIELAVQAIKEGAEHFLTKPVQLSALLLLIQRTFEHQRDRQNSLAAISRKSREAVTPFVGSSGPIRELEQHALKVAASDSPVLIHGETGSGKGVLAKWIHNQGARHDEAFVDLNCAGLPRELVESELFGHEKGAFTSATAAKQGLLEVAHRGTFFLDEIGDLDLTIQPKLLKVVEEEQFRRLGDTRDRQVDVRLIAASHRDLRIMVAENKFRSDLYFRLSAIPLRVPPLRERRQDIPELAQLLLAQVSADLGRKQVSVTDAGIQALQAYSWPGNIRELRNVLERAVLLGGSDPLTPKDLRFDSAAVVGVSSQPCRMSLEEMEKRHIEQVLELENFNVTMAAKVLQIPRSSLYQKIKQYNLQKRAASPRPAVGEAGAW